MNEVVVAQKGEIGEAIDYKAKATEWLRNMGTNLPPAQTTQFLELCQAYKLNPFKREIYAVGYGNKFNIIVGYEVYLKRAERTGKLDGWNCVMNENGTKAKITIWRKDWGHPFEHTVLMDEVRQNSPIWQKMPTFMMRKVCVEQGMRLAFPDEMGGMPYGEEEVPYDRVIAERDVTPTEEAVAYVEPNSGAPVETELPDDRKSLEKILNTYEQALHGRPYEMSAQALADNDYAKISEMLDRCKTYLGKKGIKVA